MASLVAYDDSDSEAETEAAGSVNATSQMTDTRDVVKPRGQDFAPGGLDVTEGGALATKPGSCEDPAGHRLPLARLWRSDPGSCPSRRLQWPRTEPEVTFPTNEPPCPSLWASHTPAGHVPLAAAHVKQVKPSWGTAGSPELSFCAQTKCDTSGTNGSSLQRRRREDCVIPYTPKRLRQLQAVGAETGKSNEAEARGPCARRAPAPLCVASRVSEFIQPYLDSPYKETKIPRSVLFHLRGHRGPVNGVQWCPVPSQSHMLLSASMDKTFRVWNAVDSGGCLQTYCPHSEAVRAARWSPCGQRILSGGFDFALHLTDLETGTQLFSGQSDFRITTLKFHPKDHSLFVCGGFSSEIKAWDIRTGKAVRAPGLRWAPHHRGGEAPRYTGHIQGHEVAGLLLSWHLLSPTSLIPCSAPELGDGEGFRNGGRKAVRLLVAQVVRSYKATIQQTLDILFLQEGSEFLSSTDVSSRDSADRTIIAWDFRSSAKISNQIFHERYTCPSLTLHPREPVFLAQTNGNYLALFSAVWPYRMSRRRRYEGHKVEGYSVGCECSPDGDLLVTGSADGRALLYSFRTASRARILPGHAQACVGTTFHPVLPSVLATCSWEGDVKIWH
ncbi:WD repeat-containing protein 25 isoform X1 [Equus quagga]|uniref:WD repeat-containing protein 25 isoform X1 n=1 Tax=Equus quagga TaxID=89248 RepID=UPI001EE27F5F|nr:WD repeat-containing protein 25 isoform X1 [Equus quagga]XP_046503366.1 WD repeat-containing protein 25 isoform X1 [Equus quagga]XP_046503367.1 WD repeat-containing protein 25 isoform X1 [Equus quagga]XP_046503368.1 WD repeat-containing protein 25 isoform X1 [Equus quagga]